MDAGRLGMITRKSLECVSAGLLARLVGGRLPHQAAWVSGAAPDKPRQGGQSSQAPGEPERRRGLGHRYRLLGRSSKHAAGEVGLIVSKVPGLGGRWEHSPALRSRGWAAGGTTHVDGQDSSLESSHSSPLSWV